MANTDMFQIRTEEAPRLPAPISTTGVIGWMRQNLFSSIGNTVLTVIGILIAYSLIAPLIQFAFIDAVWTGENREACLPQEGGHSGACWAYVEAYFPQFIYGRYPTEEVWRVNVVYFLFAALLIPLAIPNAPFKKINAILFLVVFPIVAYYLLTGLVFGDVVILPIVETAVWGGLLVTLVIAVTGIVASLPLGIVLALGRRSNMPVARILSVIFIEFWRGVPLITVLFMSSVMLPLFLPEGVTFDKLLRVLIGVTLFSAAYMAEVVRGGLQAIPKGQYEGAMALGLRFWPMMYLIILPQAFRLAIAPTVGFMVQIIKGTSLAYIIGFHDLMTVGKRWANAPVPGTQPFVIYPLMAMIYFSLCFPLSVWSRRLERRLGSASSRGGAAAAA